MAKLSSSTESRLTQIMALRRRFLLIVIAAGIAWSGIMQIPVILGLAPLGPEQTRNNVLFFAVSAALLVAVWRWAHRYAAFGAVYFGASFLYATAAQFLVLDDQLRMLLYFPRVGAIFLILGRWAAWMAIAAAIGVMVTVWQQGFYALSPLAISTYVFTMCVTGLFFQAFSRTSEKAMATILEQNAALEAAAQQDHLTKLLNLRAFRAVMQAHADKSQSPAVPPAREPDQRIAKPADQHSFCLAFVDVDHFKAVNDTHGHAVGDAVLVAVAQRLQCAVRDGDFVARIGGEEFALLFPATSRDDAEVVAHTVREAVAGLLIESGAAPLAVTVSIGLAEAPQPCGTIDSLLHRADSAMYRAKENGRNRVELA